jgi:type VI secretion system secreted protein VgrG
MELHTVRAELLLSGELYAVLGLHVVERLDEIPRLVATITRDDVLPKPSALLGEPVDLAIGDGELFDAPRRFRGVVTHAGRRIDAKGRPRLELVVEPPMFALRERSDVRGFVDASVKDVLAKVLDGASVKHRFELGESYPSRSYVVQYRESDLDFVRRICSEEGIALAWDHENEQLVLFDDPRGLADAADPVLRYVPEFGFGQSAAAVQKLARTQEVRSDKVHLRQYDFERPRTLVEAQAESIDDGAHALEIYAVPARSADEGVVKRQARVLLDALQSRRDRFRGSATSWVLRPGERTTIEGHPNEPSNQELLVVGIELTHEDLRSGVAETKLSTSLRFEAIPTKTSAYRPERRPRARALPGVQLATTTGPSGQEIDVDQHGRVTALFPWDRVSAADERASARLRTVQLPTGGSMFHPRVGWEVLVQCDEGDPDVPVVVGRLYNALTMPPYALPGGAVRSSIQTATTPGGGSSNEIRTDDTKGSEEMFFHASKDTNVLVKNNATESVGNDAALTVGGDQTIDVTNSLTTSIGSSQSITVGGHQKVAVETFQVDECAGSFSLTVGGNRDMKVGGDHKHTVAGSQTISVGGMKTGLVVGKIDESVGGDASREVGAASVTLTAGSISLDAGQNHDETMGVARVIASIGGVGSEVGGTSTTMIGGAKVSLVDGDLAESAGATYTSIAAGAHIVKADNVVYEADAMITLVMGASILSITPASVAFVGTSVKVDGATKETAALVVDN